MPKNIPILFSRSRTGHRGAYEDFAQRSFGGDIVRGGVRLSERSALFFLMVEEGSLRYVAVAFLRALAGRRTVGLLFRPGPALAAGGGRMWLKRVFLKLLKAMPAVRTLSIIPASIDPRIDTITDGWIYDFQLWDMTPEDHAAFAILRAGKAPCDPGGESLHRRIVETAQGRPVLLALGMQSRSKGFVHLARLAPQVVAQGWQIVVVGRVDPALSAEKARLVEAGALIEDRFVTDPEIVAAYAAAGAVWCCYDPSYDQASGILGRAIQFGVPVVVREGSFSAALVRGEGFPHLAVGGGANAPVDLGQLPAPNAELGRELSRKMRAHSLAILSEALGQTCVAPADG